MIGISYWVDIIALGCLLSPDWFGALDSSQLFSDFQSIQMLHISIERSSLIIYTLISPWPIIFLAASFRYRSLARSLSLALPCCVRISIPIGYFVIKAHTNLNWKFNSEKCEETKKNVVGWNWLCLLIITIFQSSNACVLIRFVIQQFVIAFAVVIQKVDFNQTNDDETPTTNTNISRNDSSNDEPFWVLFKWSVTAYIECWSWQEMRSTESGLQCNKVNVHHTVHTHTHTLRVHKIKYVISCTHIVCGE